jgi:hypothetical protein
MPTTTKEELQERAQLIRIHESNCKIDYPSPDEANFRIAVMKKIGLTFGLREVRTASVTGPIQTTPQRPPAAKK